MKKRVAALAAGAILVLLSTAGAQSTIHVDDDAPGDSGPGDTSVSDPLEDGSAAHPFDAIAEAVAVAAPGDTVLVHDGLYRGAGNRGITIASTITVTSEHGNSGCTLDLEGADFAFTIVLSSPTLRGLTFRNGSNGGSNGGIVRVLGGSAPTLEACVFNGGFASQGGALYVENASPDVRHCVFVSNNASSGGAVAVRLASFPVLRNCTFTGNSALFGGALFTEDSSETAVVNSILYADDGAGGSDEIHAGADVTVASSNVQGGQVGVIVEPGATLDWGASNIDVDPEMVGMFSGDIHLLPSSPCIGEGDAAFVEPSAADFEGDPVDDVDMGADEFRRRLYIGGDKSPGTFINFNAVGPPGEGTLVVASLSFADPPYLITEGTLFLDFPLIFDLVILGALPANGHASFAAQIPVSVPSGITLGWQALIGTSLSGLEVLVIE